MSQCPFQPRKVICRVFRYVSVGALMSPAATRSDGCIWDNCDVFGSHHMPPSHMLDVSPPDPASHAGKPLDARFGWLDSKSLEWLGAVQEGIWKSRYHDLTESWILVFYGQGVDKWLWCFCALRPWLTKEGQLSRLPRCDIVEVTHRDLAGNEETTMDKDQDWPLPWVSFQAELKQHVTCSLLSCRVADTTEIPEVSFLIGLQPPKAHKSLSMIGFI